MNFYREIIKNAPSVFSIPKEMRNRYVEIIILPLDEETRNDGADETDKSEYPIGFSEETAVSSENDPVESEPQPVQPDREEIG